MRNLFRILVIKGINWCVFIWVVSKSGNPGPGPVPNSYFLLIKFEHNAYNYVFYHIF